MKIKFDALSIVINSPGGSPVQSSLIAQKIRDFKYDDFKAHFKQFYDPKNMIFLHLVQTGLDEVTLSAFKVCFSEAGICDFWKVNFWEENTTLSGVFGLKLFEMLISSRNRPNNVALITQLLVKAPFYIFSDNHGNN